MTTNRFDVLGIGNALVDILAKADDDFLREQQITKGSMQLIDEARADALYGAMGPVTTVSGGSASNTIAGVASLGGAGAMIGKVRNDEPGEVYAHDLRSLGVSFPTTPAADGDGTGRCFVIVTPDGERSMSTYLGAGQGLGPDDIDPDVIAAASIVYLEGYLWDPPQAKQAFLKAADIAHANNGRVALTLSDPFCVDRYRDEFRNLISSGVVDIVFANEHELCSLHETADFDTAANEMVRQNVLAVITRSENGCVVIADGKRSSHPAAPIRELVDTTGAGDLFAAGFLLGLARNMTIEDCAQLGAIAAAEVIQHIGARPLADLKQLATQAGILLEA